jgi:prolycopene isomerase
MEKFDVVIIGAGLGGLSAAGYLAKAGKKVLVLEHHSVPGGYAQEFRRGKYRFDVALHALDGAAPGGWAYDHLKALEVLEQVHFHRIDPFYKVSYPKHDITAYADAVKYEAELVRNFPHERAGIHALIADMLDTYWQTRRFGAEDELGIRAPIEQALGLFPKMVAAMSMSWDEYMNQFIHDEELKTVFSTLWGYYGLPPKKLTAATFIFPWGSYILSGAFYPEGGSFAISRALEKTVKKFGGEIRYKQTVNRIEVKDGRAVAVETEKGLRVEADVIISNANSPDTLLKFVGREHLPGEYVQRIEEAKPAISNLAVYLGLDTDLRSEGWNDHERFVPRGYDIDAEYAAAMRGDFANAGMTITYYNLADPDCAPEGGSILNLFSPADWNSDNQWGTGGNLEKYSDNPRYNQLKTAAAEILLDRAEEFIPNLRKHIKYMEIATPLTNWRYSRNTGGSIYGTEQNVGNTYINRLPTKTPISNLFLTGAWTFGGGMSAAMLSGHDTSQMVLAHMDGTRAVLTNTQIDLRLDGAPLPASSAPQPASVSQDGTHAAASLRPTGEILGMRAAPAATLKAIGSGREITLNALAQPAVLLFHTQETAGDAAKVNAALRAVAAYGTPEKLFIANVVDLHSVPKLFRGFAENAMKDSYKQAASSLPTGADPKYFVIILPDWDSSVTQGFALGDTSKVMGFAVLNTQGGVIGTYQGDEPESHVLELLSKI